MNDDKVVYLDAYRPVALAEKAVADLLAAMRELSKRMELINAILRGDHDE